MNLINSQDVAKESEDESSSRSGWLSCDVDSSDESSAENVNDDFYIGKNYWDRKKSIAHKAILDRAYNFIYDEDFSSETTTESDFPVDNYSLKNYNWARNLVVGDAEDYFRIRNPIAKFRSKDNNRLESRQGDVRNQRNAEENRRNFKTIESLRSLAKNRQNFEECRWTKIEDKSESRFRNASRFQSAKNCKQSFSDSSDLPSETSDFDKAFGNEGRRFFSKKNYEKYPNLETIAIRRKRKLPSVNFNLQDRLNHPQKGGNGEICELENPLTRIPRSLKLSDRPKSISKIRKIYSEQILIDELSRNNKQLLFSDVDSYSSDDSLVIDVEEILQENLRGKNTRFTVETILLENKNRADFDFPSLHETSGRSSWGLFSRGSFKSETHSNEMKLLGDIKKRIDEDFAVEKVPEASASTDSLKSSEDRRKSLKIGSKKFTEIISSPESKIRQNIPGEKVSPVISNENENSLTLDKASEYFLKNSEITYSVNNTSSKSSRQYFVDSIDSGVSTDLLRNESDLSRTDNFPKIETNSGRSEVVESQISRDEENYLAMVSSSNYSEADEEEIFAEEVEKAVQKFTEELIMCERRAVERGLADEIRLGREMRKRKKTFQQARYSGSFSSPKSGKTFSSPREFSKTSQSSSEEEYLENISPPSLCSMSDSDFENLLDFYD